MTSDFMALYESMKTFGDMMRKSFNKIAFLSKRAMLDLAKIKVASKKYYGISNNKRKMRNIPMYRTKAMLKAVRMDIYRR